MNPSANVFSYLNYRRFLLDMVKHLQTSQNMSVRAMAKLFGFSSSSFLKRVTDGKKSISPNSAKRIAKALNFTADETEFFLHLVNYNQAKDDQARDFHFRKLLTFRRFVQTHRVASDEFELCSHWYVPALLELLKTELAFASPQEMASTLGISTAEVRNALKLLERLALIESTSEGFKQLHPLRQSEPEVQSLIIRQYHQQMLERAYQALTSLEAAERGFSALTVALAQEEFEYFKNKFFRFMQEVNAESGNILGPKRVYQINFQIFPLSKSSEAVTHSKTKKA